jgi:hypothetical protein
MKTIFQSKAVWLLLVAALPQAPSAWAGGASGGNGGDVVVCRRAGKIRSIELLDYFEARVQRKLSQDLGPNSLSVAEKVNRIIDRLAVLSPIRAESYRKAANAFMANANFVYGTSLVDIPDSGHLVFPAGCAVEQIAIQDPPEFPEDKLYLINGDLWNLLSKNNQAGLILHEIIYTEALKYNHPDSKHVRYFNSKLVSPDYNPNSFKQYYDLLVNSWMDSIEILGNAYTLVRSWSSESTGLGGLGQRRILSGISDFNVRLQEQPGGDLQITMKYDRFKAAFRFGSGGTADGSIAGFVMDDQGIIKTISNFAGSLSFCENSPNGSCQAIWEISGHIDCAFGTASDPNSADRAGPLTKCAGLTGGIQVGDGFRSVANANLEWSPDENTIRMTSGALTYPNGQLRIQGPDSSIIFRTDKPHLSYSGLEFIPVIRPIYDFQNFDMMLASQLPPAGCFANTPIPISSFEATTGQAPDHLTQLETRDPVSAECLSHWPISIAMPDRCAGSFTRAIGILTPIVAAHGRISLGTDGSLREFFLSTPYMYSAPKKDLPITLRGRRCTFPSSRGIEKQFKSLGRAAGKVISFTDEGRVKN